MLDPIALPVDETVVAFVPPQREYGPLSVAGEVRSELVEAMIDLPPAAMLWRRIFPGTPDQVPQARHFTRFLLADAPCRDDAELIVSELTGNAVRHTSSAEKGGTFILEISRTAEAVRIAVYDCGWGGIPRFAARCRTDAECGRGLAIVTALADAAGYKGSDDVGHMVWATLPSTDCGRVAPVTGNDHKR
jgi:serine/threonine-protein kinase RsbW